WWNSKSRWRSFQIELPVTSDGNRSGVNWMRECVPSIEAPSALARLVLPVPGASSRSTCPSANSAVRTRRMTWSLPRTACPMLFWMVPKVSANHAACSGVIVTSVPPGGASPNEYVGVEWGARTVFPRHVELDAGVAGEASQLLRATRIAHVVSVTG